MEKAPSSPYYPVSRTGPALVQERQDSRHGGHRRRSPRSGHPLCVTDLSALLPHLSRRPCARSRAARHPSWWPPTSLPVVWTFPTSPTLSIMTFRRTLMTTCTVSVVPDVPARRWAVAGGSWVQCLPSLSFLGVYPYERPLLAPALLALLVLQPPCLPCFNHRVWPLPSSPTPTPPWRVAWWSCCPRLTSRCQVGVGKYGKFRRVWVLRGCSMTMCAVVATRALCLHSCVHRAGSLALVGFDGSRVHSCPALLCGAPHKRIAQLFQAIHMHVWANSGTTLCWPPPPGSLHMPWSPCFIVPWF